MNYNGDQVAELNNVTNISKAIESSGLNLNVTNNVWLNLKYDGVEDESGNEITEINQDTTAYVRYENIGLHKDEAGENTVCITVAWDTNKFVPDPGQSYIYDFFSSCASIPLIKCLTADPGGSSSWITYSTAQTYGNLGPTAVEFYIDKDDATNAYHNYLLIQMATDSNNFVLTNSDLYIITPKEHNITTIFLQQFNYKWKEEQIHYICNKSDLQPAIVYNGRPEPC